MNDSTKILIGKIVAPQGVRGEVRVQAYTASPMDFQHIPVQSARFPDGAFKFVRRLNPTSDVIIARIDGVGDRNAAEELRGTELFVARDALPAVGDDEYYQADLIGFHVIRNGKTIGILDGFQNFGAGDIMELDTGDMVLFAGAAVDLEHRTITVK